MCSGLNSVQGVPRFHLVRGAFEARFQTSSDAADVMLMDKSSDLYTYGKSSKALPSIHLCTHGHTQISIIQLLQFLLLHNQFLLSRASVSRRHDGEVGTKLFTCCYCKSLDSMLYSTSLLRFESPRRDTGEASGSKQKVADDKRFRQRSSSLSLASPVAASRARCSDVAQNS